MSSINDIDVALVTNFDDLAQFLRSVVNKLCSPALSIRKLAETPDSADYTPAANWSITVTPTVTGGNFKWILPDRDPDTEVQTRCGNPSNPLDQLPRTCLTLDTGLANFQWEPNPDTATSTATVVERPQQGFTPGRPGADNDWTCNRKNDQGSLPSIGGELVSDGAGGFRFDLDPFNISPQEIITCTIYNSYVYKPAINLEKIDSPVQVRGDLGSSVTSTFTVTNTGNAALVNVKVTDDKCTPVYQSGDIGDDGVLDNDPAETWIYTCTRVLSSTPGVNPVEVTNKARVDAVDPVGTAVFDTAQDTVKVFAPAISLTKTPSLATVDLNASTPVTYTYVATNTGNMTLTDVTVKDDLGPSTCSPVTPVAPATAPITLAPGAAQSFTCDATLSPTTLAPIENLADVTGTPQFPPTTPPGGVNGPLGPNVTAQAPAVVNVVDKELVLTKTVDKPVILPNTEVTYEYKVSNPGSVALQRPTGDPAGRDGWISDVGGPTGTCSPVVYVSGDTGAPTSYSAGSPSC